MNIELMINNEVFTNINDTTTPDSDYKMYKEIFPELTHWREYIEPKPSLHELKIQKIQEILLWTEIAITGGFVSVCTGQLVHFDSDIATQITMQGIAVVCQTEEFSSKYPNGFPCRGYADQSTQKSVFMLTPTQILQFCAEQSNHINNCKQHGWELQSKANTAMNIDELALINW